MRGCVGVYAMAAPVDGDVVVVPAEGGQVGCGVVASLMAWNHMVGLEAVAASARIDDTLPVSGEHGPSQPFGDVAPGRSDVHYLAVCDGDGFDTSFAFGCLKSLGSDPGPSEYFHAAGVGGGFGECFVLDEHDDGFASGGVSRCEVLVQVVLGHGGEPDGLFLTW